MTNSKNLTAILEIEIGILNIPLPDFDNKPWLFSNLRDIKYEDKDENGTKNIRTAE